MSLDLKTSFNSSVELYHKRRPTYPNELFENLIIDTRLQKGARLLEIGPGTGQATKPLAEKGFDITVVELGKEMAEKARHELACYSNVSVITGAFEDIVLPTEYYDLVFSATAIHWIQPEYKFAKPHKLLKPNGYLAIIHTEHVSDGIGDKFYHASQPLYLKYQGKNKPIDKYGDFTLPKLTNLKPPEKIDDKLFKLQSFMVFPVTIDYSSKDYIDLLATYSPNLALPKGKRNEFLGEIKKLIDKDFGGHKETHYGMTLTIAKKLSEL
jgi:SAM-dependent methyltransferase